MAKPDWLLTNIEGGQRVAWRGFRRDVTPAFLAGMEPVGHVRLKQAFLGSGQDNLLGEICRFDVRAWIASGVTPALQNEAGMH